MAIKRLSTPIPEFDPTEAIQFWYTSRSLPRRPHFKESRKATGAICAQAVKNHPHNDVNEAVPVVSQVAAELVGGDASGDTEVVEVGSVVRDDRSEAEPVLEHVSRAAHSEEEDVVIVGRAEENAEENAVVNTACDSDPDDYDSGVEDVSDVDSDIEERQVDNLIKRQLTVNTKEINCKCSSDTLFYHSSL